MGVYLSSREVPAEMLHAEVCGEVGEEEEGVQYVYAKNPDTGEKFCVKVVAVNNEDSS